MHKCIILPSITCLFLLLFVLPCKAQSKKHKKKNTKEIVTIKTPANTSTDCDELYWKYVYNPSRLKVIDKCKSVTGVIVESSTNEDGDHHMLLKLDEGQEELLTKINKSKKEGNLVIEAVCVNNVSVKKVGKTCNGYVNQIQIPKLGTHVKVTGTLVNDSHNGWNEIHPITKIEILK